VAAVWVVGDWGLRDHGLRDAEVRGQKSEVRRQRTERAEGMDAVLRSGERRITLAA